MRPCPLSASSKNFSLRTFERHSSSKLAEVPLPTQCLIDCNFINESL